MQKLAVPLKIFALRALVPANEPQLPRELRRASGKHFALAIGMMRREEAPGEELLGLNWAENLLALSHAIPGGTWTKIVRSMGKLIADQRGYGALQVKLSLEQIVTRSGQPLVYGGSLAFFHGQMIGLLEPLLVVAVIPASPAEGRSQPRHVILKLGLPVPSASERLLTHRLESCLGNPGALGELLTTCSSAEFAEALLTAIRSPERLENGSARPEAKVDGTHSPEEVVPETHAQEINYNLVQVWIERAEKNAPRCYVCLCIAKGNRATGDFGSLRICGVEFSPESQIAHLSRCVGKGNLSA